MSQYHTESNQKSPQKKPLTESQMAQVLIKQLKRLEYNATTELVLNDHLFDIRALTKKDYSKVRIDVAACKKKITFIEVENGLWVTHPLLYLNFAHRVILACPAEVTAPTDQQQLALAKKKGIGIVRVSTIGSIIPVLPPVNHHLAPEIAEGVKSLILKRAKDEEGINR